MEHFWVSMRVRAIIAPPVALYRLVHVFSLPVRAGSTHSEQQLKRSQNSGQKTARALFFSHRKLN